MAKLTYKQRKKAERLASFAKYEFTESLPGEIWKDVVGYDGRYKVSNIGRVRSIPHVVPYQCGTTKIVPPRILRPGPSNTGHLSVSLGAHNSVGVHRLVLEAFVGSCPQGKECCHNDGVASNNTVENLRWDTRSANLHDAVRHGAKLVGENAPTAVLKHSDIPKIKALFGVVPVRSIANQFGVTQGAINGIRYGRTWLHHEANKSC